MEKEARENRYRVYVTDALYCISSHNKAMSNRWIDLERQILHSDDTPERSAEEIKADLMEKINRKEEPDESV